MPSPAHRRLRAGRRATPVARRRVRPASPVAQDGCAACSPACRLCSGADIGQPADVGVRNPWGRSIGWKYIPLGRAPKGNPGGDPSSDSCCMSAAPGGLSPVSASVRCISAACVLRVAGVSRPLRRQAGLTLLAEQPPFIPAPAEVMTATVCGGHDRGSRRANAGLGLRPRASGAARPAGAATCMPGSDVAARAGGPAASPRSFPNRDRLGGGCPPGRCGRTLTPVLPAVAGNHHAERSLRVKKIRISKRHRPASWRLEPLSGQRRPDAGKGHRGRPTTLRRDHASVHP